ncbi:Uncharacterised protein [Chlamydia trachomatis]|nr:Uncharacterised protein [Chlamydia trachomatis]
MLLFSTHRHGNSLMQIQHIDISPLAIQSASKKFWIFSHSLVWSTALLSVPSGQTDW